MSRGMRPKGLGTFEKQAPEMQAIKVLQCPPDSSQSSSGQSVSKILPYDYSQRKQSLQCDKYCFILRMNGIPCDVYHNFLVDMHAYDIACTRRHARVPFSRHARKLNHNLKDTNDTIGHQRRLTLTWSIWVENQHFTLHSLVKSVQNI